MTWEARMKALLIALGIVLIAGVAYADNSGEIRGCVSKRDGTLRIAGTCRKSETPLSWSQVGPQGPQGPQGSPGSLSTFKVLSGTYEFLNDEVDNGGTPQEMTKIVACPAGTHAFAAAAWLLAPYATPYPVTAMLFEDYAKVVWYSYGSTTVSWNVTCG
jgi:hypothetical protein